MPTLIGQGIEVVEEAEGVRYRLPGEWGIAFLGCGSVLIALLLACLAALVPFFLLTAEEIRENLPIGLAILSSGGILILFGILGWAFYKAITWLAALFFGKKEIRLEGGAISAGMRWWFVRKNSIRPIREVVRILYVPEAAEKPARGFNFSGIGRLVAETASGKQRVICVGRRDQLQLIAAELAERSQLPTGNESLESALPHRLPVEETAVLDEPFAGCRQSPTSPIVVERSRDGITLIIPAVGIWRAAGWRFVGSLLGVSSISVLLVFFVLWSYLANDGPVPVASWLCPLLFWGSLWVVAAAILFDCVNRGTQRAVIAIVGERLLYKHGPPFLTERREWERNQIVDLRQTLAFLARNDWEDYVLRVKTADGRSHELLEGYKRSDLHWIATELRLALGLPVSFAELNEEGLARLP